MARRIRLVITLSLDDAYPHGRAIYLAHEFAAEQPARYRVGVFIQKIGECVHGVYYTSGTYASR